MTKTPGPEVGRNLLRASYLPEDGDTPAGFAGVFVAAIVSGRASSAMAESSRNYFAPD